MEKYIPHLLSVLAFFGGMIVRGWAVVDSIATKPYVDERFEDSKTFARELNAQTLKQAYDHSDMNRQTVLLKVETLGADLKADSRAQTVKTDMVLDILRESSRNTTKSRQ
jgi:hypothetical protein